MEPLTRERSLAVVTLRGVHVMEAVDLIELLGWVLFWNEFVGAFSVGVSASRRTAMSSATPSLRWTTCGTSGGTM